MPHIDIYTTPACPYCAMAKGLLRKKGVTFSELEVSSNPALRAKMIERAGGRTSVPQIFIGNTHIGGCDDLHDLDSDGKLDQLLAV